MNTFTKTLVASSLALGTSLTAFATLADDNMRAMKKDVAIMAKIFDAAASTELGKRQRISTKDSYYLDGQGVVFELRHSFLNRSHRYHYDMNSRYDLVEMPDMPDVPVPPLPDMDDIEVHVENFSEDMQNAISSAMETAQVVIERLNEDRQQARELRERRRDIEHDIRQLEREKRDIEFERRHSDAESESLKKREKEVEQELARVKERLKEIEQTRDVVVKKIKVNREEQEKKLQAARTKLTDITEKLISETLCDYGSGLRHLKDTQKVTYLLKNISDGQDKIWVFNYADVKRCVKGDLNAASLLSKANTYLY